MIMARGGKDLNLWASGHIVHVKGEKLHNLDITITNMMFIDLAASPQMALMPLGIAPDKQNVPIKIIKCALVNKIAYPIILILI